VLRGLRTAETEAATSRVGQAARAVDAELIRVIVLAGAGCAGAAEVLRRERP
jgi:Asp/Glu/hydantoin racemase